MDDPDVVLVSLGNLISIISRRMFSRTGMRGVLRSMAAIVRVYDDDFCVEQMKMVRDDVSTELRRQHPWLGDLELPSEDHFEWLGLQEDIYGKFIQVFPIEDWRGHHTSVCTYPVFGGFLHPDHRVSRDDIKID